MPVHTACISRPRCLCALPSLTLCPVSLRGLIHLRVTSFGGTAIVPVLSNREQRNDSVVFLSRCREVIHSSKEVLSLLQEKSPAFKPVLAGSQVSAAHGALLLLCEVI